MVKSLLSSTVKTIGFLALVALTLFVMMKLLPTQASQPISTGNAYPPPENTPSRMGTPIAYPPPNTKSPMTKTPLPTVTPRGTVPPPPGWPTGQPWPPVATTPQINPTRTGVAFPTPAFPAKPAGSVPGGLQKLLYLYSTDSKSIPMLQSEQIDMLAQRWGKGDLKIDLDLEPDFPGPFLLGLYPSPDGKWVVASTVFGEATQPYLINSTTGKVSRILPEKISLMFLGWNLSGQLIIENNYPIEPRDVRELDISTGVYRTIEFPQVDGQSPIVRAIAFSPDGAIMADAVAYSPLSKIRAYCLLDIGLRNLKTQERTSLFQLQNSCGFARFSLQWSRDGRYLTWIADETLVNKPADYKPQTKLWINDTTNGEIKSLTTLGENVTNVNPPVWSTDNKLAVVKYDEKDKKYARGNIFLIDPISGAETQVSHFKQKVISNLQWSADGKWIFCTVSEDMYGAIWAVNIDGVTAFPVAGPVIANSPFVLLP